jgi:hypothetical protein
MTGIQTKTIEPLTVLTWFWSQPNGRVTYTPHHVNIWADMVRRNLTLPHRIACVTDQPAGIDKRVEIIRPPRDFEDVRIPTWGEEKPQCLRRLSMFRRDAADIFGERFVNMDMDCVVGGSLEPLFSRTEDVVLYRSPSGDIENPRPYNGSMTMMTAGARPDVYERFTPDGAIAAGRQYVGSDQAWVSHILGYGEPVWDERDGVVWWGRRMHVAAPKLMFFPGFPKPWDLIDQDQWIAEHYRTETAGRCLVLGYGERVWADLAAVSGKFAAVIASPEAAEHWTGPVLAIAQDNWHAERLAAMHGFSDVTWCGRR